jgi:hypothetical protein
MVTNRDNMMAGNYGSNRISYLTTNTATTKKNPQASVIERRGERCSSSKSSIGSRP